MVRGADERGGAAKLSILSKQNSMRMPVGVIVLTPISVTAVAALQCVDVGLRWSFGCHEASPF